METRTIPPAARTSCMGCRHLRILHDRQWPYGCDQFALRSRHMPAQVVLRASGVECRAYEPRRRV